MNGDHDREPVVTGGGQGPQPAPAPPVVVPSNVPASNRATGATAIVAGSVPAGAGNVAIARLAAPGRITDEQLLPILQSQPDLSGSVVDIFHLSGLIDLERSCPQTYALVRARMVGRFGESTVADLYAIDARIVRLVGWNTAVANKLGEFRTYYQTTRQEVADRYVSVLAEEYDWSYTDLAGLYVEHGEPALQLRELVASGQPNEVVRLIVDEADAAQAEEARLEQLAAQAETWIGRQVASKEVMFWFDDDVCLEELLQPRHGTEGRPEAVAWARVSGHACAVVEIAGRHWVFGLDHEYGHGDIFLVQQWEEARTEVVPVPSTPPGITLTTTDGYVLKAEGERFFGGTLARESESHLSADEALLAGSGPELSTDQAVRLFRQLTLDLLLTNLAAAEERLHTLLAQIYGVEWEWVDRVRALQPGTWRRTLRPKPQVGADTQRTAAELRRYMIAAADFQASTGNRDLTEEEQEEIGYTLEMIGQIYATSPLAALLVVSHRDSDDTDPVEEGDIEDRTAELAPQNAAEVAADQLWSRLDNIDTVRRHFLRDPDAVLDLDPLHEQIIDGFDPVQRLWIKLEIGTHSLRELAGTIGLTVLQLGAVVTGFFTGGLTALAAGGAATVLGVAGTAEAFESARLLSAMSALDVQGGFQLASPEAAAAARRWAYIGLALSVLDVAGLVSAGRLAARLSRVAALPDVAAVLGAGERDLAAVVRQLGMPERTLARELETLTGSAREQLLGRIRGLAGFRIAGFAEKPGLTWMLNPGGEVRSVDEAIALVRRWGVEIPEDIRFIEVAHADLPANSWAAYGTMGSKQAGDLVEWEQFYNRFEMIPVKLSREVLNSDEAIVAVISHEMHELNGLRELFEANEGVMKAERLHYLITPGNKGNLHYQAWAVADELVLKMRKGPP